MTETRNTVVDRRKLPAFPIQRLPPELLSHIFFLYAKETKTLEDLRWTKLLLVCRQWHDLGVRTPKLWAHITQLYSSRNSDRYVEQESRRLEAQRMHAIRAPLTVNIGLAADVADDIRPTLPMFWNPASLFSLTLTGFVPYLERILKYMASHSYPNLEHLSIKSHANYNHRRAAYVDTPKAIDNVLRQCSSRLQYLSISEATFNSTYISGLRSLYIKDIEKSTVEPLVHYRLQDIIEALARCPLLETLCMALHLAAESLNVAPEPATLAHLSSLSITANGAACNAILHAIRGLPSSARVQAFVLDRNRTNTNTVDSITAYLGAHSHTPHAPTIRALSLGVTNPNMARSLLGLGSSEDSSSHVGIVGLLSLNQKPIDCERASIPLPSMHVSLWAQTMDWQGHAVDFLRPTQAWQLAGVTCLDLRQHSFDVESGFWAALWDALPAVRTAVVWIDSDVGRALVDELSHLLSTHARRPFAHIVLDAGPPHRIHFASARDRGGTTPPQVQRKRATLMHFLVYAARAARAGCALDTIELVEDYVENSGALFDTGPGADWSELYGDLGEGFIYDGVLHSAAAGPAGVPRSAFDT